MAKAPQGLTVSAITSRPHHSQQRTLRQPYALVQLQHLEEICFPAPKMAIQQVHPLLQRQGRLGLWSCCRVEEELQECNSIFHALTGLTILTAMDLLGLCSLWRRLQEVVEGNQFFLRRIRRSTTT